MGAGRPRRDAMAVMEWRFRTIEGAKGDRPERASQLLVLLGGVGKDGAHNACCGHETNPLLA